MVRANTGRPRLYCSGRCRQAAHRHARRLLANSSVDRLTGLGESHGTLPPPAHPDEQVARALLEARGIAAALLRLGREARPQLAWRCEGLGTAIEGALTRYFEEVL